MRYFIIFYRALQPNGSEIFGNCCVKGYLYPNSKEVIKFLKEDRKAEYIITGITEVTEQNYEEWRRERGTK